MASAPNAGRPLAVGLLALQLVVLALALPAYEGPDEPFHLGRARVAAGQALDLHTIDETLLTSLQASPCGPDLQRTAGCPAYGAGSAWWNALEPVDAVFGAGSQGASAQRIGNYQIHQPPLYYTAAGVLLRALDGVAGPLAPRHQLVALRLLSVLCVLSGVAWALRRLDVACGWLLVMLLFLPGAGEALVRVANDAPLFAWSAGFLLWARPRTDGSRPHALGLGAVAAVGPMLKLTAAPILVYVAADRLRRGDVRGALAVALGGAVILPIQIARGWAWGGTLEMAAPGREYDTWIEPIVGIAHSAYTFFKTALWLGGWSVVKPPVWILVAAVAVVGAGLVRARPRIERGSWVWPHLAAGIAATAGFVAFALGKERLFGVWGAVGGWYFWSWSPWLMLAWQECTRPLERDRPSGDRLWIGGAVTFVLVIGLTWLRSVDAVYGGV